MSNKICIVIGASHAGVTLGLQLRKEGWEGAIKLVGAEYEMPYHRPPLSKEHLAGDKELDAMRLRPAKVFEDNGIELLLGSTALELDRANKVVHLDDGETLHYDKLAICTGSLVKTLPFDSEYANIFYIRTGSDVAKLKEQVQVGKKVLIIGAGYIGLEVAAVLRTQGLEVTVIEMADRILKRVTSEQMSQYMTELHCSHGVEIKTATQIKDITGDGAIESVYCDDGIQYLVDFVVVGIGVSPNVCLAKQAGLEINEGILVDEFSCTSDPDIFAAGDCTRHPSSIYDRLIRLESVQNANDQARIAAANICGKEVVYNMVPWFWSDQYKVKLQMVGLSDDYDEVVCRGNPDQAAQKGFALFYLKNSSLIAVDCVGRPKEFVAGKQLVKAGIRVKTALLIDESVEPADFAQENSA